MKKRATPRKIPEAAHYVNIELEDHGIHHFRVPSQAVAMEQTAKGKDAIEEKDPARKRARVLYLSGAYVGDLWFHETMDLESVNKGNEEGYGRDVHEELHEAGYSSMEITQLVSFVGVAIAAAAMGRHDIDGRKVFSSAGAGHGIALATNSPPAGAETSANGDA